MNINNESTTLIKSKYIYNIKCIQSFEYSKLVIFELGITTMIQIDRVERFEKLTRSYLFQKPPIF